MFNRIKRRERERERPHMLGIQEERSHMSLRGERHVSMCYVCYDCFALIFFYPIFSHYPISDSGGESSIITKENPMNSLHIFILLDMSITN